VRATSSGLRAAEPPNRSRSREIYDEQVGSHQRRIDQLFLYLLIAEWLFGVILAATVSPFTFSGDVRTIHFHVKLAVGVGILIDALPIALILMRPGWAGTRQAVAISQVLWSAMYIMITGGRIESHFHVFGSLAFLALYRDWRVIVSATVVVLLDHVVRGTWWPQSVYGVVHPHWWTVLEHAGWIAFEDVVLIFGNVLTLKDKRLHSRHAAELEAINANVERKVESRTRALSEAKDRFRELVENIEAVPFEYSLDYRELTYIAPQAQRILRRPTSPDMLFGYMHPDDAPRVRQTLRSLGAGELEAASFDYRSVDPERQTVHLRVFASAKTSNRIQGVALDVTKQHQLELELRQAQKLESVGRLAAGVAHEINTPIQFVNDSVRFLQTAVEDVMVVVGKHRDNTQSMLAGTPQLALAQAADAAEADLDLPFLQQAMPEAIGRAVEGIERVAAIVRSIKAFAHPDSSHMAHADLNVAVTSTLLIASSEYKLVADVVTELGDIPRVPCHVGEINQVVLNLVVNAAHAIGAVVRGTGGRGTIKVRTRTTPAGVEIAVSDTGCGIAAEIQERVFDPFFTTKDVGHGSGQGLAMARAAIVEKHHGSLEFQSEVGVGTTFFLTLPIEQLQEREAA
jgi:signal transduction histidine kinase